MFSPEHTVQQVSRSGLTQSICVINWPVFLHLILDSTGHVRPLVEVHLQTGKVFKHFKLKHLVFRIRNVFLLNISGNHFYSSVFFLHK